jgi:hypothetical protein
MLRNAENNRSYNIEEFHKYETSIQVEGMERQDSFREGSLFWVRGWRFTCAMWPTPLEVQQQVVVKIDDRPMVTAALSSILTAAWEPNPPRDKEAELLGAHDFVLGFKQVWTVRLTERPVEGAGLRIHLRGLLRPVIRS